MKILEDKFPTFQFKAHQLRGKNFYSNIVEYRNKILPSHRHRILTADEFCCFLCKEREKKKLFLEWQRAYQLYKCGKCGAISANISIENSSDYIESIYDQDEYKEKLSREIDKQYEYRKHQFGGDRYRYIIDRLNLDSKTISILDVGCGAGYFLSYLKDRGVSSKGLEVTPYLVNYCLEKGLNVSASQLQDEKDETYDVIVLFDVLEHLSDPILTFQQINRKLKRKGFCIAFTPNIHSVGYELMGAKQNTLLPFEHLCFFNEKSLNFLCSNAGFRIETLETFGLDIMDYLLMKEYEDEIEYTERLGDLMSLLQGVLDKHSISNHFRITFRKI